MGLQNSRLQGRLALPFRAVGRQMATVKAQQRRILSSVLILSVVTFSSPCRSPRSLLWTMVNLYKSVLLKSVAQHQHLMNLYSEKSLVTGKRLENLKFSRIIGKISPILQSAFPKPISIHVSCMYLNIYFV